MAKIPISFYKKENRWGNKMLEASTNIYIFWIHMLVIGFGVFWAYKLFKLSPAWKHVWVIFTTALGLSAIRKIMIVFFQPSLDATFWEVVVMDWFPSIIVLSISLSMMFLWFLFRKYLTDKGEIRKRC